MADVRRANFIAKLEGTRPNQQIRKGDADTLGLALAVDLSGTEGYGDSDRLDRNAGEQFVKEPLPLLAPFGRVRPYDSVSEFKHGHYG